MIDIKKLSVGNWVKFPHHGIDKIIDLPYIEGKGMCASFAASATLFPVSVEDLEPIEITLEILEKNGWKLGKYSSATLEFEDKRVILDFTKFGILLRIFVVIDNILEGEDFQILDIRINGVHQLQNALALCRIDKEIELL